MSKEVWKDIEGYEGHYQVSNLGRVKSLDRVVEHAKGKITKRTLKGSILKTKLVYGYEYVSLSKDNKLKSYRVHRLVAKAFIPNPNNYPAVNHKDEDRSNNNVSNLEWCTYKYNNEYSGTREKAVNANKKKVRCIETGEIFESTAEAARHYGLKSPSDIAGCCRGTKKSSAGHTWEYIEED